MKALIALCASLLQPAFLTSHLKQDPTSTVSIPLSASTHFRAISDRGPPSLTLYGPQPEESAAIGGHKDTEESKNGARDGLSARTGGEQGEIYGGQFCFKCAKHSLDFLSHYQMSSSVYCVLIKLDLLKNNKMFRISYEENTL